MTVSCLPCSKKTGAVGAGDPGRDRLPTDRNAHETLDVGHGLEIGQSPQDTV
jgi:hypothetical protein